MNLASEDDDIGEAHEINVTPFIDVILVLLIIFMVAAPLATVDVPVQLPTATARPSPRPDRPVFLTLRSDLGLALGDTPVARDALAASLGTATNGDKDRRIFVRADKGVPYGELMTLLNLMRDAGYYKVALVGLDGSPAAP